jgi:hypothetical protein
MFCQNCGKENPDDNKFCKECGAPLVQIELPPKPIKPEYRHSLEPFSIIMGFIIIATMYLLPIIPSYANNHITLAKYQSLCSDFLGCSGPYSLWFYAGWLAALFFIIIGLLNKTKA